MELVLLKDWGKHKKGSKVEVNDETVIAKGQEIGLFEAKKEKKPKE